MSMGFVENTRGNLPYSNLDALMVAFFESAGDGPEIKQRTICPQGLELPDKAR